VSRFFLEALLYNLERFTVDQLRFKIKEQEQWKKSEDITNPHDGCQKTCQDIINTLKKELQKRGAICPSN